MQTSSWNVSPGFVIGAVLGVVLIGGVRTLAVSVLIGIESGAVALVLAPLSLLVRRLILRRTRVAEPAAGASQTQP